MIMTVEEIMKRLSDLPADTQVIAELYTPFNICSNGSFIPIDEHWSEILETYKKYAVGAHDQIWECFADAKSDVLMNYLCEGCDYYDYSTENNLCEFCREVDNEDD